ncbi:pentatricopeptide repeat-containing protein 1, mitochondrial [Cephus cinctus]|uniref:Pentatricopeptide repeat-containing protein 1, mitochondrial n=1 Tax=Cephus cinctus TaxID=211228 RepID=A0AAJ7BJZ5_CEPCN|nr:pentatricopeptide repeat-containing protein 1, mitochondrial [Cephus cinctus]
MLTTKLSVSLRVNNIVTRTCIASGSIESFKQNKHPQAITRSFNVLANNGAESSKHIVQKQVSKPKILLRMYDTQKVPENPDIFGDLGDRNFERVAMDEMEEEEEKFTQNEVTIPRRLKPSAGQYADMIKSHIGKGDLTAATNVLNLVKENRDKPNEYMFSLLIRAYAVQGDIKKCFNLYNNMKKRNLKPNAAIYTSLLNVCGNSSNTELALEKLTDLREKFIQLNFPLNQTHYNALVKAYGVHNKILQAFEVVDQMKDNHIPIGESTFNSLLCGCISDKKAGSRYALVIWHLMQHQKVKPTITTYNLMLRAIRDCNMGNLKVNEFLVPGWKQTQISFSTDGVPDLLASPPKLSALVLTLHKNQSRNKKQQNILTSSRALEMQESHSTLEIRSKEENSMIPASLDHVNLDDIISKNALVLFGGLQGILDRMKADNVKPDMRTLSLLVQLVPPSIAAEEAIMKSAKSYEIELDVSFYNSLMKKRSLRGDYAYAKKLLHEMERNNVQPDILTWGILALGCKSNDEGRELIQGMRDTGFRLNAVIAGTLIKNACRKEQFFFILEVMEHMYRAKIKPNKMLYETLDAFQSAMKKLSKSKENSKFTSSSFFKDGLSKFNLRYSEWQKQMERPEWAKPWSDNK